MMICDADFDELFPATKPGQDPARGHPQPDQGRPAPGSPAGHIRHAGAGGSRRKARPAGSTAPRPRR